MSYLADLHSALRTRVLSLLLVILSLPAAAAERMPAIGATSPLPRRIR